MFCARRQGPPADHAIVNTARYGEASRVKLSALRLGDCCCPMETVVPGVNDGARAHLPVASYLITMDDGSLALVDTGMSRVHIDDPAATWRGTTNENILTPVMRPEDSLLYRLAQLEIDPRDISYVINTHLHFDHAGNNDLLGHATFFVQREQYEFAKDNPRYPNQYWNLPALRYELLDGESEPVPGITLIPTSGHTPGHQSVLLSLPDTGAVILCGDAIYCEENFAYDNWSAQADPETARASAMRLRERAGAQSATMFYGHDQKQARAMKWAPREHYT
jgi:N-acyl homoserine lactone hydrolase